VDGRFKERGRGHVHIKQHQDEAACENRKVGTKAQVQRRSLGVSGGDQRRAICQYDITSRHLDAMAT
jgi:hypothetical protein